MTYKAVKEPKLKRITVLITEKNNQKIQRFRTEYIEETNEDISYAEALNWLLNFGASDWFRETHDEFRPRFYRIWCESSSHQEYAKTIDAFDLMEYLQKKKPELDRMKEPTTESER
jgi:hypothetical protein